MGFEEFIREFAREAHLPLPDLTSGLFEIKYNGVLIVISGARAPGGDEIVVHAPLGEVPEKHELEVYRLLLEANLFGSGTADATIGVNSDTRQAIIFYRLPLAGLSPVNFSLMLNVFAEVAGDWVNFLANFDKRREELKEDSINNEYFIEV